MNTIFLRRPRKHSRSTRRRVDVGFGRIRRGRILARNLARAVWRQWKYNKG